MTGGFKKNLGISMTYSKCGHMLDLCSVFPKVICNYLTRFLCTQKMQRPRWRYFRDCWIWPNVNSLTQVKTSVDQLNNGNLSCKPLWWAHWNLNLFPTFFPSLSFFVIPENIVGLYFYCRQVWPYDWVLAKKIWVFYFKFWAINTSGTIFFFFFCCLSPSSS